MLILKLNYFDAFFSLKKCFEDHTAEGGQSLNSSYRGKGSESKMGYELSNWKCSFVGGIMCVGDHGSWRGWVRSPKDSSCVLCELHS